MVGKIDAKLLLILIIASFTLSSCNNGWKKYVIKAGQHSTNSVNPIKIGMNKISFDFKANESWYYSAPENPGWSKIRGFSNGHHQDNSSARLAWSCYNDSVLVVGAYCYVDGVSPQQNDAYKAIIDTIQIGKVYHCEISREDDRYIIKFDKKRWEGPAGKDLNWGYLLNPYIGGNFTLDHDWMIEIKDR